MCNLNKIQTIEFFLPQHTHIEIEPRMRDYCFMEPGHYLNWIFTKLTWLCYKERKTECTFIFNVGLWAYAIFIYGRQLVCCPYALLPSPKHPAATSFSTGSLTALGLYFIYFPTNTIEQLIRVHSNLLQGFKLNDVWLRGFVTVFSTLFSFEQWILELNLCANFEISEIFNMLKLHLFGAIMLWASFLYASHVLRSINF